ATWCEPALAGFTDDFPASPLWGGGTPRVAFRSRNHYIADRSSIMRAEITTIVEEIKQSLSLLRRHL
ncbi:MAG: hypothetical protein WBE25_05880, partial [Xanthobacteraceae bacterium]